MSKIKTELEDISFRYLHPEEYQEIKELVNTKKQERENYTKKVIDKIEKELEKHNLKGEVTGRPKHLYSIYRKMIEKEKKFADLNDLIAVRIVVEREDECYNALGIIHNLFIPVPGRFKDYIAAPKINGYQSIHTTVNGPDNQKVEIQIRTKLMHQIAEDGVAAHWKYKDKKYKEKKSKNEEYYAAVKKIIEKSTNEVNEKEKTKSFAKEVTGDVLFTRKLVTERLEPKLTTE